MGTTDITNYVIHCVRTGRDILLATEYEHAINSAILGYLETGGHYRVYHEARITANCVHRITIYDTENLHYMRIVSCEHVYNPGQFHLN